MISIAQYLPHDVLKEIFKNFSFSLSLHAWDSFPWFLGHISSEWRQTFLSMTLEFWNEIEIDWLKFEQSPRYAKRQKEPFTQIVKLFLERNTRVPFSFTFRGEYYSHPNDGEFVLNILGMLMEESARWLVARISLRGSDAQALTRVENRLPLLRELELLIPDIMGDASLGTTFLNTPSLQCVRVSRVRSCKIRWSSLTNFSLDMPSSLDLSAISLMVRVERLNIAEAYTTLSPTDPKITLSHLKSLGVWNCGWFPILEAPALEELSIRFGFGSSEAIDHSFLRKSGPTLRRLKVMGSTPSNLAEIAEYAPNIRELVLKFVPNANDVFHWLSLAQSPEKKRSLPKLQLLELWLTMPDNISDYDLAVISSLVMSRGKLVAGNSSKSGLQLLRIKYGPDHAQLGNLPKLKDACELSGIQFEWIPQPYITP